MSRAYVLAAFLSSSSNLPELAPFPLSTRRRSMVRITAAVSALDSWLRNVWAVAEASQGRSLCLSG